MRNNIELRNLAWKRLWADHWFGRLFGGGLLLGLCGHAVQVVLNGILRQLGVQSWFGYFETVVQNQQDLTTPVPNLTPVFISQATSSTVLTLFFSFIMSGIASYGGAVILKKCLANDDTNWLGEAFGGFRFPFGMLWLQLRYWLISFGWGLLGGFYLGFAFGCSVALMKFFDETHLALAVTAVTVLMTLGVGAFVAMVSIPFYRYRFLFLVKAEHPDWSAGTCIRSCKALMEGHKMESFKLDCSYWKPIALVLLLVLLLACGIELIVLGVPVVLKMLLGVLALMSFFGALIASVVVAQYISVGQGFFYQDLKDGQTTEQDERN